MSLRLESPVVELAHTAGFVDEPLVRAAAKVSLEMALYAAVVAVAIFLRLRDLGTLPLGADEARRAFEVWRLVEGHLPGGWSEPVPDLLAAGSFFIFGSSDLAARIGSVLVGCALPALCWMLRPLLGRGPALWAALLFSLSPLGVYVSRALSGDVLVMALGLLLVVGLFHYMRTGRSQYAFLAAASLPALLLSGPGAVSILLIALLFFALVYAFGSARILTDAWQHMRSSGDLPARLIAVALAGFLLLSTACLTNLPAFGLPTLSAWLVQFNAAPGSAPWYYHLELLLAYEPLTLMLGLAGLALLFVFRASAGNWWAIEAVEESARSTRRSVTLRPQSPIFVLFIAFWAVLGLLVLVIVGTKTSGQAAVVLVPLTFLAALALDTFVRWMPWPLDRITWLTGALLVVVFGFFLIALSEVTLGSDPKTQQTVYLILSAAATLLVLGASAPMLREQFRPLLALFAVVVLAAFALHATARTSHQLTGAELVFPGRAQPDVARAAREITTFARQAGVREDLPIVIDPAVQEPLRWYLRAFPKITIGGAVPDGPAVVVSPWQSQVGEANAGGYVVRVGQEAPYQPSGPLDYWRWLIYGESRTPPVWTQAVLQFQE